MNYFTLCMVLVGMMDCKKLIIKTNRNNYLTHLKGNKADKIWKKYKKSDQAFSLVPKSSPRKAPVDYALSFKKKAKNVNLMMEKGANVNFAEDVDKINVEYFNS